MNLTGPFQLEVFCDHTMAPGAHQGHFPSPKHTLQEAHVQFILTASLDVDLCRPLQTFWDSHWNVCVTLYKGLFSSASVQPLPVLKHSLNVCTDMNTQFIKYLLTTTLQGHARSPHLGVTMHKFQTCSRSVFSSAKISLVKSNSFWYRNRAWPIKGSPDTNWKMQRRGRGDGSIGPKQTAHQALCLRLCFLRRLSKASILFLCVSGSRKLELACLNPPATNLLEQKRVWDGDEENIGVFSTPADSCSSLRKGTKIFHKSLSAQRCFWNT